MKVGQQMLMFLSAALLWATTSGCSGSTSAESIREDASQPTLVRVAAAHPTRKTLVRTTVQPGRVEAYEVTPLYPKVTGYVEKVLVDIGDRVEAGDALVTLSAPELLDDVSEAEASVGQAEAQVEQAAAQIRLDQAAVEVAAAMLEQVKAGVIRAQADIERCRAEHGRIKDLAASGSVTDKLVDESLNQLKAAEAAAAQTEADVAAAMASLKQAQASVAKAQADLRAAEARWRVAQSQLARARTMAGYATIRAPFAGIVTQRNTHTGHYVAPANGGSSLALLVIARADKVRVFVDVPESDAALVDSGENGDPAVIRIAAGGPREILGSVTRTSWSLGSSNRSLTTEIDLANDDGTLRPGMYVTAAITLEQRADAIVLPTSAILQSENGSQCCCIVAGRIERRTITLGLRSGNEVEVTSGIAPEDLVVLSGGEAYSQGQPVEVLVAEKTK